MEKINLLLQENYLLNKFLKVLLKYHTCFMLEALDY